MHRPVRGHSDFLVSHADPSVSFVLLHQDAGASVTEKAAALRTGGSIAADRSYVYDLTGVAELPSGIRILANSGLSHEILRRLQFFVSPALLPISVTPLLVKAVWEECETGVVLAYEGVAAERLLLARQMLQAGSEAVLLRNDRQESIVLGLAWNTQNKRLVQHWADCVVQFCTTPHPHQGELEPWLGSSLASYLCDHVATLQGLDPLLDHLEKAQHRNGPNCFHSENRVMLRLAVRKLLASIRTLQSDPSGSFVEALNRPAPAVEQHAGALITNLMHVIWGERQDLQHAFDLAVPQGRRAFIEWFLTRARIEFELGEEFLQPVREARNSDQVVGSPLNPVLLSRPKNPNVTRGLNLIGYPRAEMGMGEQLRSCADSLAAVDIPFAINDFHAGIIASHADRRYDELLQTGNPYPINLFHINADQLPLARERLGQSFLRDHYNIGYWEWELSRFPDAWLTSIDMVDEIWAPSKFIYQAISAQTQKPVVWMPLAMEFLTPLLPSRPEVRAQFGLPANSYLFLFSFDFSSFSTRKNYRACLKAFRTAFQGNENVGLVLKTIRHPHHKKEFWEMLREIGGDQRIHLIDAVLRKPAMRMLIDVCDCFVSLHRSEGFGLSIAEAMYLEKPVIVTNYSGNVDFTRKENAYLVDYELIPVKEGEYVFPEGQVWADPDVEQAAGYMRRLYANPEEGRRVGQAACDFLKREHSLKAVGKRYAQRINQILAARTALLPTSFPGDSRTDSGNSMRRAGQMIRKIF